MMDSRQQTLRMTRLPRSTQIEDVENFFGDRIPSKGRKIVESVGPISQDAVSQEMQTTVSFSSHEATKQALELKFTNRRLIAVKGGAEHITLSHGFEDITTFHTSNNPATGRPDIDVVALHGLRGHAWNTFTTSEVVDKQAGWTREHNWLRDSLPRLLEQHHQRRIYSRVMSFGYNADVWMTKSVADLDAPKRNLLHYLELERQEDPSRPLFFIGHSLGGIVIKQVIVALANKAMIETYDPNSPSQKPSIFPVKGCMFFGVPHKGADVADTALRFLSVLSSVFNINKNNIKDLIPKSQRFANISSEFRSVQSTHNIPIMSFYETVKYSKILGIIVNEESAVYECHGCPEPFGVNRNHRDMAKFSNADDHALRPAVHFLTTTAADAIERQKARSRMTITPQPPPHPLDSEGHAVEDKLSILENYDTVFLIDDSPSMRGEKWELVQQILNYSIALATRYDRDGIDVHFMNNSDSNKDRIKDPKIGVKVHQDIELRGNTPTLDKLSRHLKLYLQRFKAANFAADFRGYNLILLTDGEPNPEYEGESDISDPEDAKKYKAAFRLIRKKIVEVAKKLDEEDAEPGQVGIQFCQIGNDYEATVFFQYLDDRLKSKHKLGRDMVDTIKCQSELDLTAEFYEKLLLGAIDKRLDSKKMDDHDPARYGQDTLPAMSPAMPHRQKVPGRGKERQWSDDETLVGPSSRWNSVHANRSSTMTILNESPVDDVRPTIAFQERPTSMATSRRASPPLLRSGPPRRYTDAIQEAEESEPRVTQRSSTFGSRSSRWCKPNTS